MSDGAKVLRKETRCYSVGGKLITDRRAAMRHQAWLDLVELCGDLMTGEPPGAVATDDVALARALARHAEEGALIAILRRGPKCYTEEP